ncbi:MAG: hypothetical protein IJ003_04185 [Candidatus Gastranaerophilales bacterium]|nr:hypothetical protein [Candidatus Gastranaerophilales bacterium]
MQNIKTSLFLYLTPRQKSQLLGTLKAYSKKFQNLSSLDLVDKFLEDEKYYINIENPHFEFVGEYFNDDKFLNELKKFFDYCIWERKQLELMQPYIDKQKEYAKEQRKKAQEFKMSKLKPTKKQLFYYEKITKAHNIEKKDTTNASRLDLRNWIMEILDKYN